MIDFATPKYYNIIWFIYPKTVNSYINLIVNKKNNITFIIQLKLVYFSDIISSKLSIFQN